MTSPAEQLVQMVDAEDRYDIPHAELLPLQLQAANDLLESRISAIPLLANRAEAAGIKRISKAADLLPLLFAHTTYKSYSQGWLTEGRWEKMGKWLETVSTYPVEGIHPPDIRSLDDWVTQLRSAGHFVTCSSGTTGKPALLSCSEADLELSGRASVASFSWATGVEPRSDRKFFGLVPPMNVVRNERIRLSIVDAFASRNTAYFFPLEPITISSIMDMVTLRRRIADGEAGPGEIAEFENLSRKRQAAIEGAFDGCAEALVESRGQKLVLSAQFATLYQIAQRVRAKGFAAGDFRSENALMVAGGLKGAVLPPDYREIILDTFNVQKRHVYHVYSMQEINTPFPMCSAGRYHVAPWVMMLPVDASGEQLLETGDGELEARAAFFDISLQGRWGGVISGDRVAVDFRTCNCGHEGPSLGSDIVRYADLAGGDKISCAGTIEAYVRGAL